MSKGVQNPRTAALAVVLAKHESSVLAEWIKEMAGATRRADLMNDSELRRQCSTLLKLLREGAESGSSDVQTAPWQPVRELLTEISRTRAQQGFTPTETSTFILSVKKPLFELLRDYAGNDANAVASELWSTTELIDSLGLYTAEMYLKTREDVIRRQQEEMLELSTPVVKLWDGILALPIIGTLDSARTQVVMEELLQTVVATNSKFAIIDITGVPTVDTLVAQHLLKTITAARLMGAERILSGIRPQIAQTIVHLGINLEDIITESKLSDAFRLALERSGRKVIRLEKTNGANPVIGRGL